MSTLKVKAQSILDEKNNKIIPENIKAGIQIFNVTGTLEEGINTDDATARGYDMAEGKTAYVGGIKIEGTVPVKEAGQTQFLYKEDNTASDIKIIEYDPSMTLDFEATVVNPALIKPSSKVRIGAYWGDVANAIGLTSDKIVTGNTVLGVNGTATVGVDTSDATATEYDIAPGVTAYTADGLVHGRMNVAEGMSYDSEYSKDKTEYRMFYDESDHKVKMIFRDDIKVLLVEGTEIETRMLASDIAQAIGLTSNQIVKGNTVLDIEGTYQPSAVTFATIEEMNNNTAYPENTFAVVYGTEYVGTYKLDSGAWTQIGDATDSSEMMSVLNSVDGEILEYEGNGGTDDEINAVLDDILTNPNDQGATEDPGL